MRAVGLIAEYNPFHNGHLHHLRESLRVTGAEVAVAVMSGHFLQRGEPALVDKWVRAEMALGAGVDVVVELPFPWACNSAPQFALGAVWALEALGGIDCLCFGSEAGTLPPLRECADLLLREADGIARGTAELLRQGVNYPTARARCVSRLGCDSAEVLGAPNNILGIEYLKALRLTGSGIVPYTIRRLGAGYHDPQAHGTQASATGIRRMLREQQPIFEFMPLAAHALLLRAVDAGQLLDDDLFYRLPLVRILQNAESLRGLYQIENGIEHRLFEAALTASDCRTLVDAVKSRHLTRTRVQRLLAYILNEVRADEMRAWLAGPPPYLHLLACGERGRAYLAASRKDRQIPLVANYSRMAAVLNKRYGAAGSARKRAEGLLRMELRATRNYTLLMRRWRGGHRNRDYFQGPGSSPSSAGER